MRAAFVFLTRIPVGGFPYSRDDWRWATAWFPFVGFVLAMVEGLVYVATQRAGALAAAGMSVAVATLLTGAFHEDGLADTADALGGSYDRETLFRILKDSRIGSFGGAALAIALILRVALLAHLGSSAPVAMLLSRSASRLVPVWMMTALPYVTMDEAAKSKSVTRATVKQALWGTLVVIAIAGVLVSRRMLANYECIAVALSCCGVGVVVGWRFWVRAGGITGDFLGATQQISEIAILLVLGLSRG